MTKMANFNVKNILKKIVKYEKSNPNTLVEDHDYIMNINRLVEIVNFTAKEINKERKV